MDRGEGGVRCPLARSRPQRHPRQPAGTRGRSRGGRRGRGRRDLVPWRHGRLRRRSRRLHGADPRARLASAWSATTTWRCWGRSTSRPSPRRRPPRSSGRGRTSARRRSSSSARSSRSASRAGVGLFHASPRDPIWEYVLSTDQADAGLDAQEERVGLIGHSHVSLFFVRATRRGAMPRARRAGERRDGDRARRGRMAAQPRQRRPAPRRRPARSLAGARHRALAGALPPPRVRRRGGRGGDPRGGPPRCARRAPGGRPLTGKCRGNIALRPLSRLESWPA